MFCTGCGNKAKQEANFCSSCGTRLERHGEEAAQSEQNKIETLAFEQANDVDDLNIKPESYESCHSRLTKKHDNQVRPWVRFWARKLDFLILTCLTIVFLFLGIVPLGDLDEPDTKYLLVLGVVFAWILIEAIVLGVFGTTPGKSLFKIKLTKNNGSKVDLGDTFPRTFLVWIKGLGLGIPIVWIFTTLASYFSLKKKRAASWDTNMGLQITHEHIGGLRIFFAIMLFFVLAIGLSFIQIILEVYTAQPTQGYSTSQKNDSLISSAQVSDNKTQIETKTTKQTEYSKEPKPSVSKAGYDLFHLSLFHNPELEYKTEYDQMTRFWFEKNFKLNDADYHSKFFATRVIDPSTGETLRRRAHGAEISVVTYKLNNSGQWEKVSAQAQWAELGSWGNLNRHDYEERYFSPSSYSLLFEAGYSAAGVTYSNLAPYIFYKNKWYNTGYIRLGANDCHTGEPCFSYSGQAYIMPNNTEAAFPDILVKRTGSDNHETSVSDSLYRFNGEHYKEVEGSF